VVVFVPQIALLFLFLAALEDSGYLARAPPDGSPAGQVGLHGKSFIPCCPPSPAPYRVMAARTIDRPRERLATILVAPS